MPGESDETTLFNIRRPRVPRELGEVNAPELVEWGQLLQGVAVSILAQQQLRKERWCDGGYPEYPRWRRRAMTVFTLVSLDRKRIKAELTRRQSPASPAGTRGPGLSTASPSGKVMLYPLLNNLAKALATWPGAPIEVVEAAFTLSRGLETHIRD